MRRVGRWLVRVTIALIVLLGGVWLVMPRPGVDAAIHFQKAMLGDDLEAYLANEEHHFSDITPGAEKRIIWAGAAGARTPFAVVYLHGYSATSEEIRPVPDEVAKALGANLFFTRFTGHGRGGAAMGQATAGDWINDTAEALAIGKRLGDKVIVHLDRRHAGRHRRHRPPACPRDLGHRLPVAELRHQRPAGLPADLAAGAGLGALGCGAGAFLRAAQ